MNTLPFDSHESFKRYVAAGFTEQQAEEIVNQTRRIIDDKIATKYDIVELRTEAETNKAELKRDIEELRKEAETNKAELKRDIEELRKEAEANKAELKRDIEQLRSDTQKDLKKLELGLTIKLGTIALVCSTAIIGILGFLLQSMVQ